MNAEGLGFRSNVFAQVLAGLIVAAVLAIGGWVFSFHHAAWLWTMTTAGQLWAVLIFPVPVPAVAIFLIAGAAFVLWRRHPSRRRALTSTEAGPPPQDILSRNEELIVRVLADADGQWLTLGEIASTAGLTHLMAEQAYEKLDDRQFVIDQRSPYAYSGRLVHRLSSAGRDYAIARGYVK